MLATCAYIDLNPVAAAIAEVPETSAHTSIKQRVEHVKEQGRAEDPQAAQAGSVARSTAAAGLEEGLWLCPVEDRRRLDSSRERMIEGFSLGNYVLLVEYTGRLFREGKAVISGELAGVFERLGSNARTGRRGCRSWPRAGCWADSSPPAVPGCGKSPSIWACTTWRTWAAARRDDAALKARFQARLHFTLPETLARVGRFCRRLSMSGSCGGSLAIRCEKQARAPPRRKGGARRVLALTRPAARNGGEWLGRVAGGARTVASSQWMRREGTGGDRKAPKRSQIARLLVTGRLGLKRNRPSAFTLCYKVTGPFALPPRFEPVDPRERDEND